MELGQRFMGVNWKEVSMGSAPRSDAFLPPPLAGSCACWCLLDQGALECKQESLGQWSLSCQPQDWPAVVIFVWRSQCCETAVASRLSMSLGNHTLSGSCVSVYVTVNIQKIECFLVLNLRSHLLDSAN